MPTASQTIMRTNLLPLCLAACGGAAVSFLCLHDLGMQPVQAQITATTTSNDIECARLAAEVAALRQQLDSLHASQERTAAAAPAAGTAEAPRLASDTELLNSLLRELTQQQSTGVLRLYFQDRLGELTELLMRVWIETGSPQHAFRLLTTIGPRLDDLNYAYAGAIVEKLRAANDPLATEASLYALSVNVDNPQAIADLAKNNPQAALDALDAHERANGHNPEIVASLLDERCGLLLAMKNTEGALPLFDQLLATGTAPDALWEQLIAQAPAVAMERLQTALQNAEEDHNTTRTHLRLSAAMLAVGDKTAARRATESLLTKDPNLHEAIELLAKIDRRAARAFLQHRADTDPSPQSWATLAQHLLADGDSNAAHTALWSWHLAAPDQEENQMRVIAASPPELAERVIQDVRRRGTRSKDFDELLGDLGEVYWRNGQCDRAIAAWREARQLDPIDAEWKDKLQRIANGRDPLYSPLTNDWWRNSER